MILKYQTGKLPLNFIYLGVLLLAVSIWRMIVLDWVGILLFVISLLCIFIRSGIIIDTSDRKLKKYIGFFMIRTGEWINIESLINLQILKTKETQSMGVLSLNRTETNVVYKLMLVLPDNRIEIMAGERDFVSKSAKEISEALQVKFTDSTQ